MCAYPQIHITHITHITHTSHIPTSHTCSFAEEAVVGDLFGHDFTIPLNFSPTVPLYDPQAHPSRQAGNPHQNPL